MSVEKIESLAVIESINIWLKDLQRLLQEYRKAMHLIVNNKTSYITVLQLGGREKIDEIIETIEHGISTILCIRKVNNTGERADTENDREIGSGFVLGYMKLTIEMLKLLDMKCASIGSLHARDISQMYTNGVAIFREFQEGLPRNSGGSHDDIGLDRRMSISSTSDCSEIPTTLLRIMNSSAWNKSRLHEFFDASETNQLLVVQEDEKSYGALPFTNIGEQCTFFEPVVSDTSRYPEIVRVLLQSLMNRLKGNAAMEIFITGINVQLMNALVSFGFVQRRPIKTKNEEMKTVFFCNKNYRQCASIEDLRRSGAWDKIQEPTNFLGVNLE